MTEPLYRWLTPTQFETIREYGFLDYRPGEKAVGIGVAGLAWQLRSNQLTLEGGHVVLFMPMLRTASAETLSVVQSRTEAINAIIDQADLHPVDLEELKNIFNELENLQNG